jgi:glycine cleavage system transcriptional repressor
MTRLALTAIGRDRPGIVAGVTAVLLRHGVNVEDSQMAILGGHFTMTLILAAPAAAQLEPLSAELDAAGRELGLEALVIREVEPLSDAAPEPTHVVTVYGVDHPGIVHAATRTLAERGINVTDLNTRLLEETGEQAIYVLMMEVVVPAAVGEDALRAALAGPAALRGVDISVRERERERDEL